MARETFPHEASRSDVTLIESVQILWSYSCDTLSFPETQLRMTSIDSVVYILCVGASKPVFRSVDPSTWPPRVNALSMPVKARLTGPGVAADPWTNSIWVGGGFVPGQASQALEQASQALDRYHVAGDVWECAGQLPIAVSYPSLCVASVTRDDKTDQSTWLILTGGVVGAGTHLTPRCFWVRIPEQMHEIKSDAWTTLPALPESRAYGEAVVVDGRLVVAGGFFMSTGQMLNSRTVDCIDLRRLVHDPMDHAGWQRIGELPEIRTCAWALNAVNGNLLATAGEPLANCTTLPAIEFSLPSAVISDGACISNSPSEPTPKPTTYELPLSMAYHITAATNSK